MSEEHVEMVIPADRLPAGFAQRIGVATTDPAVPQPAATAVLMRDGESGVEVLLLKRLKSSGFVPGAYVFAGGRVDHEDGDDTGITADRPSNPDISYWIAAIREVFEESGVLLAIDGAGVQAHARIAADDLVQWREKLLAGNATLSQLLVDLELQPDFDSLAYAAHWITPLAEARRYDTRFFYAAMPAGCEASADAREMSDAVWLSAEEALSRFRAGRLPMVFPTVRTIQDLEKCRTVKEAMAAVRGTSIKPIMPSLVRIGDGVGIVIDAAQSRAEDRGEAGE